jgi:hypothetical protein
MTAFAAPARTMTVRVLTQEFLAAEVQRHINRHFWNTVESALEEIKAHYKRIGIPIQLPEQFDTSAIKPYWRAQALHRKVR